MRTEWPKEQRAEPGAPPIAGHMELMAAPGDGFGSGGKNNPHNNQQKNYFDNKRAELETNGLNGQEVVEEVEVAKWRQRGGCSSSGRIEDQDNNGSNKWPELHWDMKTVGGQRSYSEISCQKF